MSDVTASAESASTPHPERGPDERRRGDAVPPGRSDGAAIRHPVPVARPGGGEPPEPATVPVAEPLAVPVAEPLAVPVVTPPTVPVTVPDAVPAAVAAGEAIGEPGAGDSAGDSAARDPEADRVAGESWPAWRASLLTGFWTWLAGIAMYAFVTTVAWVPFGGNAKPPTSLLGAFESWHRWDTTWYMIIADEGYRFDSRSTAFFPLYPLMIRALNRVLPGDAFAAALVISVLACLATLVLVHRLTAELVDGDIARRTTFYLLAFPTGFYLAAAYNESLFIALAVGSLYCMRRRQWLGAGVLAGLASATRLVGVLLAVAFVYEYLRQRRFSLRQVRGDLLFVAFAPSGVLLYALYCARTFGDPLYFQKVQSNWFRDGYTLPWVTLWQDLQFAARTRPVLASESMRNNINLATAIALLVLLAIALTRRWGLGRDGVYLVIFSAADILLPMSSPIHNVYPLSSMWRFALECVPVFMVLAKAGRDHRFDRLYLMTALAVQGVMIVTFIHEEFVA